LEWEQLYIPPQRITYTKLITSVTLKIAKVKVWQQFQDSRNKNNYKKSYRQVNRRHQMEVWKLCVKGIFLHQVENCFKKPRVFQLEVHLPDYFGADQKLKHVVKGTVQMPLQH